VLLLIKFSDINFTCDDQILGLCDILLVFQSVLARYHRRIYGCVLHLDSKDGKIWIQHNGTEFDIAAQLAEQGIPKQNIVNGFHSSYMRQFTDFAVG
jgi:XisI protein